MDELKQAGDRLSDRCTEAAAADEVRQTIGDVETRLERLLANEQNKNATKRDYDELVGDVQSRLADVKQRLLLTTNNDGGGGRGRGEGNQRIECSADGLKKYEQQLKVWNVKIFSCCKIFAV